LLVGNTPLISVDFNIIFMNTFGTLNIFERTKAASLNAGRHDQLCIIFNEHLCYFEHLWKYEIL